MKDLSTDMNKPRKTLVIFCGIVCLFFAFVMIAMAGIMYALETDPSRCVLIGSLAAIPLLVTVACFAPSKRSIALRILGTFACIACAATLVLQLKARLQGEETQGSRLGILVTATIGTGIMAWKGKWPGADEPVDEQLEDETNSESPEPRTASS